MRSWLIGLLCGVGFWQSAVPTEAARPLFEVVQYGKHPHQYFYILNAQGWFRPLAPWPRPAFVYFHGGGFTGGGPDFGPLWADLFINEITVVAPSYRLISDGATKQEILEDGARVVQFLRQHAQEYNVDAQQIGVGGFSAGGVMAAWIALHDDLAKPDSPDPVLRQSSRVKVAALYYTQVQPQALNDWQLQTGADQKLLNRTVIPYLSKNLNGQMFPQPFRRSSFPTQAAYEAALAKYETEASPFEQASADDPPVCFLSYDADNPMTYLNAWYDATGLHSPLLMIPLRNRLKSLNVPVSWGWLPETKTFLLDRLK